MLWLAGMFLMFVDKTTPTLKRATRHGMKPLRPHIYTSPDTGQSD